MRTTKRLGWALALVLAVAGVAHADTSAGTSGTGRKPGGDAQKARPGKPGDACKTASDCDQSSGPQSCVNAKCSARPMPPPVT
jgi:hypothetical protein